MTKKHILFVCTGNTCRSPMAEGLCRKQAEQAGLLVEVRSAGVSAMDGAGISQHSYNILRDKGALASMGSSSSLSREDVEWADLILTMTMSHKRAVIQRFPQAMDKVHTLKEFTEDNPQILEAQQAKEALLSELQLKQALGQQIHSDERERLIQLELMAQDYDISDPYGGSRQDYEETAIEIETAVVRLIRKLQTL